MEVGFCEIFQYGKGLHWRKNMKNTGLGQNIFNTAEKNSLSLFCKYEVYLVTEDVSVDHTSSCLTLSVLELHVAFHIHNSFSSLLTYIWNTTDVYIKWLLQDMSSLARKFEWYYKVLQWKYILYICVFRSSRDFLFVFTVRWKVEWWYKQLQ